MNTMKHFSAIAILAFLFTACAEAPKSDQAEVGDRLDLPDTSLEAMVLKVDTDNSYVSWIGTKPTGSHNGTIKISHGKMSMENDILVGGDFTIDMKTLKVLDMDEENNAKLGGHLMSEDFFTVEEFPTAKFELVSTTPLTEEQIANIEHDETSMAIRDVTHRVTGNLTMMDKTRSVTFPARINISNDRMEAVANFNIDRTDWGVTYGSDRSLGDNFIRPTVNIGLNIKAEIEDVVASN